MKFSCYQKLLMLKSLCFLGFFFCFFFPFKEFTLIPWVRFPTYYNKMKCQNTFHFLAHFILPSLLGIVISIYNSLHLALLWMLSSTDFCPSIICFLSVASGEPSFLFIVWQKQLTFEYNCSLKQLLLLMSLCITVHITVIYNYATNCISRLFVRSAGTHWQFQDYS